MIQTPEGITVNNMTCRIILDAPQGQKVDKNAPNGPARVVCPGKAALGFAKKSIRCAGSADVRPH